MEYALPYKSELDSARSALHNAMAGNQSLQANVDILKEESSRRDRISKVQHDSSQMEINTLIQANDKLKYQLNNELDSSKLLSKSAQQLDFDNNLLKHQVNIVYICVYM